MYLNQNNGAGSHEYSLTAQFTAGSPQAAHPPIGGVKHLLRGSQELSSPPPGTSIMETSRNAPPLSRQAWGRPGEEFAGKDGQNTGFYGNHGQGRK